MVIEGMACISTSVMRSPLYCVIFIFTCYQIAIAQVFRELCYSSRIISNALDSLRVRSQLLQRSHILIVLILSMHVCTSHTVHHSYIMVSGDCPGRSERDGRPIRRHPVPGGVQCVHGAACALCGAKRDVPGACCGDVQRVSLCNRQGDLPALACRKGHGNLLSGLPAIEQYLDLIWLISENI